MDEAAVGKVGVKGGERMVSTGSCGRSVKCTVSVEHGTFKKFANKFPNSPDSCPSCIGQTVLLPGQQGPPVV